jgi:hypothetical protein
MVLLTTISISHLYFLILQMQIHLIGSALTHILGDREDFHVKYMLWFSNSFPTISAPDSRVWRLGLIMCQNNNYHYHHIHNNCHLLKPY